MKASLRCCALIVSIACLGGLAGCSDDEGSSCASFLPSSERGADVSSGVRGTVFFEKRTINNAGHLSRAEDVERRPARFVKVELVSDTCSFSTVTDGEGGYGFGGPVSGSFRILVTAETSGDGAGPAEIRIQDYEGNGYATESAEQGEIGTGETLVLDVTAPVDSESRVAGAFNIIDVLQTSAEIWTDGTGIRPADCAVNWRSGGATQPGTFFNPESNQITLLGGLGTLQDSTDTDEFDDVVVAHEYLHFLGFNHGFSSSPGGRHGGEDLLPNLAFEEGYADWFGAFITGESFYRDSIGNLDGLATCGVCDDIETSTIRTNSGIGSEQSIYEILWDLIDGHDGQPADVDGDGVSVPVADVLNAYLAPDRDRDVHYVGLFLENLVALGNVQPEEVRVVLNQPPGHDIVFPPQDRGFDPPNGRDLFPIPVSVGTTIEGAVDAIGAGLPATERNASGGFNSVRYYLLDLDSEQNVVVTLTIDGSGQSPGDLDLVLLDPELNVIDSSVGTGATEEIRRRLPAGGYVIAVMGFFIENNSLVPNSGTYTLEVN